MFKKIIILLFVGAFIMPAPMLAATFRPGYLISDDDLMNANTMSSARIQKFLETKGSALATMKFDTLTGKKSAADVIYDAGKYWGISPKYLLVRMQVEQSLVTDSNPTQKQIDYATGFACPDSSGCNPAYKGFFNQVNWAAKSLRGDYYLGGIAKNGTTISGWGPMITKQTLDGISVTPMNAATAVLYTYTPWVGKWGGGRQDVGGSSLVWKKYEEWFATAYPDGTLLQVKGNPAVYLIQFGTKRAFWSKSAFTANYTSKNVIQVPQQELDKYPDGKPIRFSEYSILGGPDGSMYLILNGQKRLIESQEVFRQLGYNPEEVITVTEADLKDYTNGTNITLNSIYPTGALLQSKQTGGIVFVENGVRHAIWSKEIMQSRFPKTKVIRIDESEIAGYAAGDPVKFKDGELVTSPNSKSVYVISDGLKRPIGSMDAFNQLGYKWKNIIKTSDKALEMHPTGDPINVN
ncbi:MAG: hypothetical protein WC734_00470 [Patescibacteria group bacterium]|jgi:hypothetical protein